MLTYDSAPGTDVFERTGFTSVETNSGRRRLQGIEEVILYLNILKDWDFECQPEQGWLPSELIHALSITVP